VIAILGAFHFDALQAIVIEQMTREFGTAAGVTILRLAVLFKDPSYPDARQEYESEDQQNDYNYRHVSILAR
jgi:hypothetical protein